MRLLSTTKLAQIKGVTSETIRRWIREGKYETTRNHGGHYRIIYQDELQVILYARVSSSKQKTSLIKQEELLKDEYPQSKFLSDVGSGFNFKRRNFVRILEQVLQ